MNFFIFGVSHFANYISLGGIIVNIISDFHLTSSQRRNIEVINMACRFSSGHSGLEDSSVLKRWPFPDQTKGSFPAVSSQSVRASMLFYNKNTIGVSSLRAM